MVIFVSQVVAEMKGLFIPSGSGSIEAYFIVVIVFVAAVVTAGILDFYSVN